MAYGIRLCRGFENPAYNSLGLKAPRKSIKHERFIYGMELIRREK
jgi:hypothetical protein